MGFGTHSLKLPRKEGAHFLSLVAGGAVLMTVFFLFISTASEQAQHDELETESRSSRGRKTFGSPVTKSPQDFGGTEGTLLSATGRGTLAAVRERTLVIYLYSRADPVYQNNLNYFIRHGMSANDGCDYIFVVQGVESQINNPLPQLAGNAQWFYTTQAGCELGMGMIAEVLNSGLIKKDDYKHFIFMNSSVRGPFVPSYAMGNHHWTHYFTQKLNEVVKLVGPTISCQPPRAPEGHTPKKAYPHVQFSVVATDQAGLAVLEADPHIMQCHNNTLDEQFYSELGASAAILRANYSLDCFMTRYRRVDWKLEKNWECNKRLEPLPEFNYDGSSVHPYEVMFVNMDTIALENGWSFAKLAALYETWITLQDQGANDVTTNAWVSDPWPIKRQRIAYMQSRGPGCFDNHYYLQKNADLKILSTALELWDHFVMMGQFEGRSFRWSCEDDRKLPWEVEAQRS